MKAFLTKYANTWGTNDTTPLPSTVKGKEREVDSIRSHSGTSARGHDSRNIFDSNDSKRDTITKSGGSDAVRLSVARAQSDPILEAPFVIVGSSKEEGSVLRARNELDSLDARGTSHTHLPDGQSVVVPVRKQSIKASTKDKKPQISSKRDNIAADNDSTPKQSAVATFHDGKADQAELLDPVHLEKTSRSAPDHKSIIESGQASSAHNVQLNDGPVSFSPIIKHNHKSKIIPSSKRTADTGAIYSKATKDAKNCHPFSTTSYTPTMKSGSQDLAGELNELAIAHNEGFLGEEEYRMLRQAAFQKKAASGGMDLPREDRFNTRASYNQPQQSPSEATASSPPASMASRRSSRSNILSLFRKPSSIGQRSSADSAVNSSLNVSSTSIKSKSSKSAALQAEVAQARRARSIRSSASYSGAKVGSTSSSDNAQLSSLRKHDRGSSGLSGSSGVSVNGISVSDGSALFADNYRGKSTSEIEAEIAILEAEGKRILEGFNSLQMSTIGRYKLDFDELKKVMDLTKAISSRDQGDGHLAIDQRNSQGDKSRNKNARKSKSFGALKVLTASDHHQHRKRESSAVSPPSSYRDVNGRSNSSQPMMPLGLISPNDYTLSAAASGDDSDEMIKLRLELADILRRRNEVSKKYADRLAFLRSTLRSAKIRQTLK